MNKLTKYLIKKGLKRIIAGQIIYIFLFKVLPVIEMRRKEKDIIEKEEQEKEPYLYMRWPELDDLLDRVRYDLRTYFDPSNQTRTPIKRMFHTKDYLPVDIMDEGDHFQVHAELPGVKKENVEVDLKDRNLTISVTGGEEKEQKDKDYFIKERSSFSSRRSITLPDKVIGEKAEGKMDDGVLWLKIPKETPTPKKTPHKVNIK